MLQNQPPKAQCGQLRAWERRTRGRGYRSMEYIGRLKVWIYAGSRRRETYLYVPAPDDFERVPSELLRALGPLRLVMHLDLSPDRPLARANANEVIRSVESKGFYLQLPPIETQPSARPH